MHQRLYSCGVCLLLLFSAAFSQGDIIGMGHVDGVVIISSDPNSQPSETLERSGFLPNHNAAAKLTAQTTFGATLSTIEEIAEMGFEDWVDAQMSIPIGTSLKDEVMTYHNFRKAGESNPDAGTSMTFWDYAWWQYHMTQPDFLRQRVAFALSEIIVISRNSGFGGNPYAFGAQTDLFCA